MNSLRARRRHDGREADRVFGEALVKAVAEQLVVTLLQVIQHVEDGILREPAPHAIVAAARHARHACLQHTC